MILNILLISRITLMIIMKNIEKYNANKYKIYKYFIYI